MSLDTFREKAMQDYAEAVARGEHDDQCEYIAHPYICHCSKRRRIAAGHTEPPGELLWQHPICPRCNEEVDHDGDDYTCPRCCCWWDDKGITATFYDDYGDAFDADTSERSV